MQLGRIISRDTYCCHSAPCPCTMATTCTLEYSVTSVCTVRWLVLFVLDTEHCNLDTEHCNLDTEHCNLARITTNDPQHLDQVIRG